MAGVFEIGVAVENESAYTSVFRSGLLSGKVVLVTGGGSGIGRCIGQEVASLGGTAILLGRKEERLRESVKEIRREGGDCDYVAADIRDPEAVDRAVDRVLENHATIDGLVNCAGGQFPSPAVDLTPNGWRTVVDLNLNGTFFVSRKVFEASMSETGGSIVSVVANVWNGFPFMAHSGAARAGIVNLTKTLAIEWAPFGVRVNAVAPGIVDSGGLESYDPEIRELIYAQVDTIPAGRMGTVRESSAATVFLLSIASAYTSGETIKVDGGASLLPKPLMEIERGRSHPSLDGAEFAY